MSSAQQIPCSMGGLCENAKTLLLVNLEVARGYPELLADKEAREEIFAMVETEYRKTEKAVQAVMEEEDLSRQFARFGQRVARRLPVLLSINCIAAGLGWTA